VVGPPHGSNQLPARVSEIIYLGPSVRYHLETPAGGMVAMAVDRRESFDVGDSVGLSWSPGDVWVIQENGLQPDA
jgi:ABC-type Fe3+/spermidine/putrescine transport system ATPase subunit